MLQAGCQAWQRGRLTRPTGPGPAGGAALRRGRGRAPGGRLPMRAPSPRPLRPCGPRSPPPAAYHRWSLSLWQAIGTSREIAYEQHAHCEVLLPQKNCSNFAISSVPQPTVWRECHQHRIHCWLDARQLTDTIKCARVHDKHRAIGTWQHVQASNGQEAASESANEGASAQRRSRAVT